MTTSAAETETELRVPAELPFLASISWFDADYRALDLLGMLSRYEAGWRYLGVLGGRRRDDEAGMTRLFVEDEDRSGRKQPFQTGRSSRMV